MDTNTIRERLLAQKQTLQDLLDDSLDASGTVELDQTRIGRLTRMDAMQQQAMSQATRQRQQLQLRQTEAALTRLEQDDYGMCLECGETIAQARLQHDPAATLCIDCAEVRDA